MFLFCKEIFFAVGGYHCFVRSLAKLCENGFCLGLNFFEFFGIITNVFPLFISHTDVVGTVCLIIVFSAVVIGDKVFAAVSSKRVLVKTSNHVQPFRY